MTIHDRIRKRRETLDLSQAELARRVGVSTQAVQQWESSDLGTRTAPRRATRKKVAEVLGVSLLWLDYGDDVPEYALPPGGKAGLVDAAAEPVFHRSIPLIGFAVASPDEDGYFDDMGYPPGVGMGMIPWASRDPNAYALEVKKDSMQPRIRPGEFIVVEPNSVVEPGDDVVVRTKAGRKMVKQLLHRRGTDVTLGSINQSYKQITLSVEEIESMHFVAGIAPRSSKREE